MNKTSTLRDLIESKQTLIMIYSDRDMNRVNELSNEVRALQMQLLDIMTLENELFLEASKGL
jgi:hypothetical protein